MRTEKLFCILAVAAIITLARVAFAQEDTWSSGGPYEASPWSIAIDPADSMHLYIGTQEDFVYQTTNGGAEWSTVSIEGSPDVYRRSGVVSVNIHPFGPDTMFIATHKGAFKSTDAGETWSQMFHQWPEQEWNVSEINHANPPVLFLGTGGSAYRSTDSGQNWMQMPFLTGSIKAIKADPVNPNIIYAANNTTIPNRSIWKSTNSGMMWQNIHNNIQYDASTQDAFGRFIEVDPVDPAIIYFSRLSHVYVEALLKSTNGGEFWIDITPPGLDSLNGHYLHDVVVSPLDHNTVLLCTDANGVLRSTDGGATWEEANRGIIGVSRRPVSLTADPTTGIIYLGWHRGGIYRSLDNGVNWEKISYNITGASIISIALNRRHPDTLFTTTYNGLYMSTDGAISWEYVELDYPDSNHSSCDGSVEVDPYDPSYVYVSYNGHFYSALYRSTDGGANWGSFTQGLLPGRYYGEIEVADYGGGYRRLFMGSYAGLFRSDDLGESWSLCRGGMPADIDVVAIAISPNNPDIVFAGEADWSSGRLYKTTDGGETWTLLATPAGTIYGGIACDPMNSDIVYLTVDLSYDDGRIYKSTDGGQTWIEITNDIPHGDLFVAFTGLAINPFNPDNVFVWSCREGIFQSHDGGQSWEDFNFGLEPGHSMIGPLALTLIDPVDSSRVFVGVMGGSVWTITRTQTGIDVVDNTLPAAFSASSYPNPFNPSATIEYSLPDKAFVTVDIYDLLGRKVETLVSQNQQAGNYRVVWDAKDRASGLYFYKIDIGESSVMKKMILLK